MAAQVVQTLVLEDPSGWKVKLEHSDEQPEQIDVMVLGPAEEMGTPVNLSPDQLGALIEWATRERHRPKAGEQQPF